MPKSSSANVTPRSVSPAVDVRVEVDACKIDDSVISIRSRFAASPTASNVCATETGKSDWARCRGEMLTQTAAPSVHEVASIASLPKHPLTHVGDQATLLGNAHERSRFEQTVHRMLPANQGLTGLDRPVGQPHDRLVVDPQLAFVQRAGELRLERQIMQRDGLRGLVEDVDPGTSLLLRAIHRGIGLVEQRRRRRDRCRP